MCQNRFLVRNGFHMSKQFPGKKGFHVSEQTNQPLVRKGFHMSEQTNKIPGKEWVSRVRINKILVRNKFHRSDDTMDLTSGGHSVQQSCHS